MSQITAIKPQKNQKRVNIYLDNKFGFGLDLENFVKLKLKLGQELDDEQVKSISDRGERAKVLTNVLRFASIRPRSEKEIKDYFKRKSINVLIHRYILGKLRKYELLDDTKFAKWLVDVRLSQGKSQRSIIYDLKMKGISQNTIDDVLGEIEIDEVKIAKDLITKKSYKWQKYDEKVKKQKISQYLAGKGFSWNIVSKVVK